MAPDTLKFSRPSSVIVQEVLVVYLEDFIWKEIYHHVPHKISVQTVCSNHYLLQLYVCINLCHVEN